MARLRTTTMVEQVAAHLREGIGQGRWRDLMPGREQLSRELNVSPMTVVRALALLEREKVLAPQGTGRRRQILLPKNQAPATLRIAILPYEMDDAKVEYMLELQHALLERGHSVSYASKSLQKMNMNVKRVARLVEKTEADAWIVVAGSQEVLKWFSQQSFPTYGLFGRFLSLPMAGAGPVKSVAVADAVKRLVELGHQRIVMLAREDRRKPEPGLFEQRYLEQLQSHGIPCGPYNLPDWDDNPDGFQRCLDSLFRHTPPTALIIQTTILFTAAHHYLARRGILAPEHVSLICTEPDPDFSWCQPSVAHIRWDSHALMKQVVRWVDKVARGQRDLRHSITKAEFVEGGTVGPAPKTR